ncbi:hypothetical protein D3C86_2193540 [compost metagenome]
MYPYVAPETIEAEFGGSGAGAHDFKNFRRDIECGAGGSDFRLIDRNSKLPAFFGAQLIAAFPCML